MKKRLSRLWLGIGLALLGGQAMAQQLPTKTLTLDIPAMSLRDALHAFATQSGLQVVFPPEMTKDLAAKAVTGDYTPQQALTLLLADTSLRFQVLNPHTVAIRSSARTSSILRPGEGEGVQGADEGTLRLAQTDQGSTATTASQDPENQTNAPGASQEATGGKLEEIIVTAQKQKENLQDVPLTVKTISGEELRDFGATRLADFAASLPGLSLGSVYGNPGSVNIVIRGISTADTDNTPTVATFIDDFPVSCQFACDSGFNGPDLNPWDVDHVEVLEGPQGTLYGGNSLGGVLKYVTREPDLNQESFRTGASTLYIENAPTLGWGLNGVANMPIIPGELALSASASHQYVPGFIDNIANNTKGINHGKQDTARLVLLWHPTDPLTVKLDMLYDLSDFAAFGVIQADSATNSPTYGWFNARWLDPQRSVQSNQLGFYTAEVTYDFGWASLKSLTADQQNREVLGIDVSSTLPAGVIGAAYDHIPSEKFSQEVRLASPETDRLHWLVGAFYTHEQSSLVLDFPAYFQATGLFDQYYYLGYSDYHFSETAAFANATYRLTDQWDVGAGVRYSHDAEAQSSTCIGVYCGQSNYSPTTDNAVTYSATVQYHIAHDTMAYARIATGFRPGGQNIVTAGAPASYGPDKTINYELGLKSEWFEKRLLVNADVFYIDWKDVQLETVNAMNDYYYSNAAIATSQGLELTARYLAMPGLQFGFNGAFTDAFVGASDPAAGAAEGDRLPITPRWAGALTADYTHAVRGDTIGRIGMVWRYVGETSSEFYSSAIGQAGGAHLLPPYHTVNVSAGLSNERWDINLYINNLADERAFTSWLGFLGPVPLQPRTIGLNIAAKFK